MPNVYGLKSLDALDSPGAHLWVINGVLAVADPERPVEGRPLGGVVEGPGCLKCQREYSRRLARQPCLGSVA